MLGEIGYMQVNYRLCQEYRGGFILSYAFCLLLATASLYFPLRLNATLGLQT